MAPTRVISGQETKLARTVHGIAYDSESDEIIVPNPIAAAILVFRGGASGAEAPIRVIQGVHTQLTYPHSVNVDSENKEILVGDPGGRQVLVFPLDAQGDVPPLRVIKGPRTGLGHVVGVASDTVHDLLIVSNSATGPSSAGRTGLLIFNRRDSGDLAPRQTISGPKTGILYAPWQVQVDGTHGTIFVAVCNVTYRPRYLLDRVRDQAKDSEVRSPWNDPRLGFVGAWSITDTGDVAPRSILKGPVSGLVHPDGLALNPKNREIIVTDSVRNGALVFSVPEFFRDSEKPTDNSQR
jgi:hypothetical protein